jgi:uncharacterized protein (TIGR02453 family)
VPFPGFPKDTPRFLSDLSKHNDRAWFEDHRDRYEESYLAPAEEFVLAMGEKLRTLSRDVRYEPKINGSISRINRDIRFSKDKRPYKDHLDLWFWQGKDRKAPAGYWFSLTAKEVHLGAGAYMFSPEQLAKYRDAVVDGRKGAAFAKLVETTTKAGYEVGGASYKRVPAPYDKDHPRADLLKHTGLYVYRSEKIPAATFTSRFVAYCLGHWRKMAPVEDWIAALA